MVSANLAQLSTFSLQMKALFPIQNRAIVSSEGICNWFQVKNIACSISNDIHSNPKKPWPPNAQDITNLEDAYHRSLYNFTAWIISPNLCLDSDEIVRLSKSKSNKVKEIC